MEKKKPIRGTLPIGGKKQARKELLERREAIPKEQAQLASAEICKKIEAHPWFAQAEAVYFYYPLGREVSLLPLAERALTLGMQVAFPRVRGEGMDFYEVTSLKGFCEGAFHVMEPAGGRRMQMEAPLVLVPGVGFDLQGTRMGYGKGYYDRYFARYPKCRKIGAAYEAQLAERLPRDAFDVPMDGIVTERNRLFFTSIAGNPFPFPRICDNLGNVER